MRFHKYVFSVHKTSGCSHGLEEGVTVVAQKGEGDSIGYAIPQNIGASTEGPSVAHTRTYVSDCKSFNDPREDNENCIIRRA